MTSYLFAFDLDLKPLHDVLALHKLNLRFKDDQLTRFFYIHNTTFDDYYSRNTYIPY